MVVGVIPATVIIGCSTTMKKRCLPCYLIVRNVLILLMVTAGVVYVSADLQATANRPNSAALALRQLFVYQLLNRAESE